MKPVACIFILWGATTALFGLATVAPVLACMAIPALAIALACTVAHFCLYRPPENHLGVIYRLGRFDRWVDPDQYELIIPGIDTVRRPISLYFRPITIALADLQTKDLVPIECEMLVYYQIDLRRAHPEFLAQALQTPDAAWEEILRSQVQEIAGDLVRGATYREIMTAEGCRRFKNRLGRILSDQARNMGIVVDPQFGISIQAIQPISTVWAAHIEQFTAPMQGEAARERIRPTLEEIDKRYPGVGRDAMFLEWAATIAKEGTDAVPRVVVVSDWGAVAASNDGRGDGNHFGPPDRGMGPDWFGPRRGSETESGSPRPRE